MTCGEKIAELRKKSDMTQDELGKAMNVSYQAVSKWERGESQPDFGTMSRIAKLFGVPIGYFEEDGELEKEEVKPEQEKQSTEEAPAQVAQEAEKAEAQTEQSEEKEAEKAEPQAEQAEEKEAEKEEEQDAVIGVCTVCGKMLKESEVASTSPKIVCKACAARQKQEALAKKQKEEAARKRAEEEARQKRLRKKAELIRKRNLGLWIAIIPTVAVVIGTIVGACTPSEYYSVWHVLLGGIILTLCTYCFTAQMIWGGVVRSVCTGGGHVMSTPGVIFSLSPSGIIFLIVAKIFLALVAGFVFIASILACALAAIVIAPFCFIPALIKRNREISQL